MLAALILLGLLPLAAMPLFEDHAEPDESENDATDNGDSGMSGSIGLLEMAGEDSAETTPEGEVHQLDAAPGLTEFPDFQRDFDIVQLDLTGVDGPIYFDTSDDPSGSVVSFSSDQDEAVTLSFPELEEVPSGDIMLRLDANEDEVYEISLDDAILMDHVLPDETETESDVLAPNDPDLPDAPGPDGDTELLAPVDPDLPDQEHPEDPVGDVIAPTPPDEVFQETPSAKETSEVIDQANAALQGLDLAIPDPAGDEADAEPAVSTEEDDGESWVYSDLSNTNAAPDVGAFRVGEDFLRVQLTQEIDETDPPDIDVRVSEDGADGVVYINGDQVATLRGAPDATLADIFFEVVPESTFAAA